MKKILITGYQGMLGKDIWKVLSQNKEYEVYGVDKIVSESATGREIRLDLLNFEKAEEVLKSIKPDVIVHCAANINVDACQKEKELAYALNVSVTEFLSKFNPEISRFIYISTDSVFDGKEGNYSEDSLPNPLNYYAFTKLEGEKKVLANNNNSVIIRTNIYGFHSGKGNSLVEWALENFRSGRTVSGFEDIFFNPVYTKQLAKFVDICLSSKFRGIINVASDTKISKYEFLVLLAKTFGYSQQLVEKSSSNEVLFTALRPKNTILNVEKLKKIFGLTFSLNTGMEELENDYYDETTARSKNC